MSVLFLHGVNVRDGEEYRRDLATRDALIRQLLLAPLAVRDRRYADLAIVSPYWGGLGVTHAWEHATLPRSRALEQLGLPGEMLGSALEQAFVLGTPGPALESLGAAVPSGTARDPEVIVEAALASLIHSEEALPGLRDESPGYLEGLLLAAACEAARDPAVRRQVIEAPSNDAALEVLRPAVQDRFRVAVMDPAPQPGAGKFEDLGFPLWDPLKRKVDDLFDRAKAAGGRAASLRLLEAYRERIHRNIGQFLGDVFTYLTRRGTAQAPGFIPSLVLKALRDAERPDEPLLAITHSMGGNILYDLLTTFAPDLRVDAWISAGGQMGQFEEMKIFLASDPGIRTPAQVASLGGRVRIWLNVYDPADVLSFLVSPVFRDEDPQVLIKDLAFNSRTATLEAHGAYFKRPSFYDLIRAHLESRP